VPVTRDSERILKAGWRACSAVAIRMVAIVVLQELLVLTPFAGGGATRQAIVLG
jgi:hypothetical protein